MSDQPLLSIRDFTLEFETFDGVYKAIDRVNIDLAKGESLGIVGETGCGKSVTAKSILQLLPSPPARVRSGEIVFNGENLLAAGEDRMRAIRGIDISMIFQDPMTYLNPVFTVGQQLVDVIMAHQRLKPAAERMRRAEAKDHAIEMLRKVHLPNPERQFESYPYQLSGGMRQRVLIAQALSGRPQILVADEPTTALDVTIQAQILDLIAELIGEFGLSVVLITHDLGVVATVCSRVVVMYAGQVVEDASVEELFNDPKHPYTKGLLSAVPHPQRAAASLAGIPGSLPNLLSPPEGCRFQSRCPQASEACRERPPWTRLNERHRTACWLFDRTDDA
ncbi:MAG: ABC transporter ATP-binding protein [Alphaproteobacteria bacterium]|jgi:oligopeptide/dipeptide ABC transporter ATP-binding protein|nr:ABC transporter ATP-binding protein [Alphaproteobacteria bacterium]